MSNPYAEVHRRIRAHQGRSATWVLPVLATALATPLARPVLLGFLDAPASTSLLAAGTEAIAFRVGAVIAAALSLHTFSDLVRGPDREVLDVHPVQARPLLAAIALRTARERFYLPLMGAILLSPLALAGHVDAWLGAVSLACGAWLAGLGVGFATHLAAVEAARSPGLATVLDLIRGDNPPMQAALIYAPGFALGVSGVAIALAAGGLSAGLQGWAPGWAFLALPPLVGLGGGLLARPLADRAYVRASSMLAEIDAAWANVEEGDEERRVYLEWLAQGRPELLRALRQGWRRLRSWPMGAWGLGVVGALSGWSADPGAPAELVAVAGAAVALVSALPGRLAEGDPEWLDRALGVSPGRVARARGTVAFLYAQGAVIPGVLALGVRQGFAAFGPLLLLELFALAAAAVAAAAAWRWRQRGAWAYAPIAVLGWAAVAGLSLSGAAP